MRNLGLSGPEAVVVAPIEDEAEEEVARVLVNKGIVMGLPVQVVKAAKLLICPQMLKTLPLKRNLRPPKQSLQHHDYFENLNATESRM